MDFDTLVIINIINYFNLILISWPEEMAEELRVLATPAEDLGLVPSTYTVVPNHL